MSDDGLVARHDALARLRDPFSDNQISVLPKPKSKDAAKGNCNVCHGYHGLPAVHLEYVGHAALTDRLLEVDPEWTWEPLAYDNGLPAFDRNGGLWIRLTICGVTRLGYGDSPGKQGGNAIKEAIGDALRNAGMRFGAALDLWHKGDLHDAEEAKDEPKPDPVAEAKQELATAVRTAGMDVAEFASWAISARGPGLNIRECTDLAKIKALTERVAAGEVDITPTPEEAQQVIQEQLGGTPHD